ncbi:sensor histidine kinase [Spongiimicrobium salis]|uniref:sensor histidine kinase n=1 Tax=Spongiimicrobium salis TaxID=1667022 RepID=UPI00374DDB40
MNANTLSHIVKVLERFKVHHILFWAAYHFIWWTVFTGSVTEVFEGIASPHGIVKYLGYVVYQALGVYFCLYFIIPKFLQPGRYFLFFLFMTITIFLMATAITTNYFVAAWIADESVYSLYNVSPETPLTIFKHNALTSCVGAMTLGMSIKLTKMWMEDQKRQQKLEKEKLETELKFLKSQFNPHFLFNTINSIFVLINKDPKMASNSLVQFSNLLRYQLYECNSAKIPLENELNYIQNFIQLERLRQNQNFDLEVNLPKEIPQEFTIAPFILIPFIENAFKHVSEDQQLKKWITLKVVLKEESLMFEISNSANFEMMHALPEEITYGGLGLKNVRRRLDIIYPEDHTLVVVKGKDHHNVSLQLVLSKAEQGISLKKVSG